MDKYGTKLKPRKKLFLTSEQKEDIIDDIVNMQNLKRVASKHGVDYSTVYRSFKNHITVIWRRRSRRPEASPPVAPITEPCTLCSSVESPGFYTGCMVKDGHVPGAECILGMISRKPVE